MPLTSIQKKVAAKKLARRMFADVGATANFDTDELEESISGVYDFFEANGVAINNTLNANVKVNASLAQKSQIVAVAAMKYGGLI